MRFAAAAWLFTQLSVLVASPASLLAATRAADAPACTCSHTGHDACPMHHPKPRDPHGCECRSTTDPANATLVSLLGPIAVMPHAIASVAAPPITQLPSYPITGFASPVTPPDGPPPRG
ncbi:MAG TPA: hypothetical protein VN628_10625 [Vicinamibacterales bacterium]|nr:hypothetical protein [Vicinamibacterales bacterium]